MERKREGANIYRLSIICCWCPSHSSPKQMDSWFIKNGFAGRILGMAEVKSSVVVFLEKKEHESHVFSRILHAPAPRFQSPEILSVHSSKSCHGRMTWQIIRPLVCFGVFAERMWECSFDWIFRFRRKEFTVKVRTCDGNSWASLTENSY